MGGRGRRSTAIAPRPLTAWQEDYIRQRATHNPPRNWRLADVVGMTAALNGQQRRYHPADPILTLHDLRQHVRALFGVGIAEPQHHSTTAPSLSLGLSPQQQESLRIFVGRQQASHEALGLDWDDIASSLSAMPGGSPITASDVRAYVQSITARTPSGLTSKQESYVAGQLRLDTMFVGIESLNWNVVAFNVNEQLAGFDETPVSPAQVETYARQNYAFVGTPPHLSRGEPRYSRAVPPSVQPPSRRSGASPGAPRIATRRPASARSRPSPPPVRISKTNRVAVNRNLERMFGRVLRDHEIGRLVGALPGAKVSLLSPGSHLRLVIQHPLVETQIRSLIPHLSATGDKILELHHDIFRLKAGVDKGTGFRVFSQAVMQARRLGIESITTTAAGDASTRGNRNDGDTSGWSGYLVWPKFGYDAPIPFDVKRALPPQYSTARNILDLHTMPGGEAWWAENGHGCNMTFDLGDDSGSMQQFRRYAARKNLTLEFR